MEPRPSASESTPPEPSDDGAQAMGRRDRMASRLSHRFGLVLVLLLLTFMFLMASPSGAWSRLVTVALQGATLVAALAASQANRHLRLAVLILAAVGLLITVATLGTDADWVEGVIALMNVLFVAIAPVVIVRSVMRRRVIDISTVLAALCVYVLLGMLWAFVFTAVGAFQSHAFFVQDQTPASSADFLYFSFVTQTTVGYGDLTAATDAGRAFAVLEALIGQIYLVTVVALLVSNLMPGRRGRVQEGAE